MANVIKQKIMFLDRDGTICIDEGGFNQEVCDYEKCINTLKLIDGSFDAIKKFKQMGFLIVVISNQAGVAKGIFRECDVHRMNKKLNILLDGMIDGFYYCPHHPDGLDNKGNKRITMRDSLICDCDCRKPNIGLFKEVEEDLKKIELKYYDDNIIKNNIEYLNDTERKNIYKKSLKDNVILKNKNYDMIVIDKENSYMVGDKYMDTVAGKNYGIKSILVLTGEGEYEKKIHENEIKKNKILQFKNLEDFFLYL